ncbi:hypothetical protein [Caldanaerobius polysaccharolyticus]|uniref:hypothetical protein n=1 Tax=Caldanaerobius polysaccharolyticus TaxID=44256 RepID=UPI0004791932|nr:hypothetical protein [Caldanaerobius polysaccharolyticus]
MIRRYRDALIMDGGDEVFVVTCDSLGSIGRKPLDALKVDEEIVGRYTLRVALAEALCLGAWPLVVCDTLCNEMFPTGRKIIEGIKKELEESGFYNIPLTGSTEENFETMMTGIGITVISKAKKTSLKVDKVRSGMSIALVGYPRVGQEVMDCSDVLSLRDYIALGRSKEVKEVVPVGSRGIAYEVSVIEGISSCKFLGHFPSYIDAAKSGGPSTCAIVVYERQDDEKVRSLCDKPFTPLGIVR